MENREATHLVKIKFRSIMVKAYNLSRSYILGYTVILKIGVSVAIY